MNDLLIKEKPVEGGEWGGDGHLQLTRTFVVRTPERYSMLAILALADIPKRFSFHPDFGGALCTRVAPRRIGPGNRLWEVTCQYTTDWLHDVENPLERPADITWRDTENLVASIYDLDGKPFVSTSGELLEEVMIESPGEICTIVKNLPGMPTWFPTYRNAVNSQGVWIDGLYWGPGVCRIKSRSLTGWKRENEIDYRQLTMEIHMRPDGWQRQYLNRGFYQIVEKTETVQEEDEEEPTTVTKKIRKRILIDGKPAVEPQLLDIDGKMIEFRDEDGELIPESYDKVREAVLDFKIRKTLPFSVLPLK